MNNPKDITEPKVIIKEIKKAVRNGCTIIFQQVDGNYRPCGNICEPFVSKKAIAYFNNLTYVHAKAVIEITGTLTVKFRW